MPVELQTPLDIKETDESVATGLTVQAHAPVFVTGWRAVLLNLRIQAGVIARVFRKVRHPVRAGRIYYSMARLRLKHIGRPVSRFARAGGKYYHENDTAGWPSVAFNQWIDTETERRMNPSPELCDQKVVFLAITKKCPLRCAHCFEWENLNRPEVLSKADIGLMVRKFRQAGAMQIQFSGGEPLLRYQELAEIVQESGEGTEFWMVTSGYGLTREKANKLKSAGFTGICVSIDHYREDEHDKFRGHAGSFRKAVEGAMHAVNADLVVCLNVCVTRDLIESSGLRKYLDMARKLGASFVQLLEPRAVGHWLGKDVELREEHFDELEQFMTEVNHSPAYNDWPIITYHGWHQRRVGCFGAGNRFLYVDTDGDLHSCPFCQKKGANVLTDNLPEAIGKLRSNSCGAFGKAPYV